MQSFVGLVAGSDFVGMGFIDSLFPTAWQKYSELRRQPSSQRLLSFGENTGAMLAPQRFSKPRGGVNQVSGLRVRLREHVLGASQ